MLLVCVCVWVLEGFFFQDRLFGICEKLRKDYYYYLRIIFEVFAVLMHVLATRGLDAAQ